MESHDPRPIDLICRECPLRVCDQNSLWCVHRFLTDPNRAQIAIMKIRGVKHQTLKRRAYFAERYRRNKENNGSSTTKSI